MLSPKTNRDECGWELVEMDLKVGDTWYYNNPSDLTALSDNNVFAHLSRP